MVNRWIRRLFDRSMEKRKDPWALFEIAGFEDDGRIKVNFNWNKAFIEKIQSMGFHAETEEDSVQLFFYASTMRPTGLAVDPRDDSIQSLEHPTLSSINNEFRV